MRIIDTYGKPGNDAVTPAKPIGEAASVTKSPGHAAHTSPAAKVTLSLRAHELAKKSADDADASKVEALRASIHEGSFQIDRQAIAKRIVDGG